MIDVTEATFDVEVLDSKVPVLVDFYAPWCKPCKAMLPLLEACEHDYARAVKFVKVDCDANGPLAADYGVRGVPTLILFVDGSVNTVKVGALTKGQLTSLLDSAL